MSLSILALIADIDSKRIIGFNRPNSLSKDDSLRALEIAIISKVLKESLNNDVIILL